MSDLVRLTLDTEVCIGVGQCELLAPDTFELDDDEGTARIVGDADVDRALAEQVEANLCFFSEDVRGTLVDYLYDMVSDLQRSSCRDEFRTMSREIYIALDGVLRRTSAARAAAAYAAATPAVAS